MAPSDEEPEFVDFTPIDGQVNVRSTWRSSLGQTTSSSMMTDALEVQSAGIQTTKRRGIAIQTVSEQQAAPEVSAQEQAGLSEFVARAGSLLTAEIKKTQEEHEALEPFVRLGADEKEEPAILLHELSAFGDTSASGMDSSSMQGVQRNPLVVTSLSWSATGQTIAAAYGRYDIMGWCTDRGALVTWNLGRESINTFKPDINIEVDNCLMACAFHPDHPALIAGGTFNGDLYVWDLSQEGDFQKAKSDALSDLRHREPICTIAWQYSMTEYQKYGNKAQAYRIVTLGADGRVMVWQWHKLEHPVYGYQLLWPSPGSDRKILWGGTCMAFQRGDPKRQGGEGGTFVVGTEGGKIFKCYNDLNDSSMREFAKSAVLNDGKLAAELRCPIKETEYTPHAGAVYGADCSPFQRDLFLTGGADGSVRLYHLLKQQVLLVLEPTSTHLYGVQWSPFRPLVFSAAAGDGRVYFYDLLRTRDNIIRPMLSLDTAMGSGGNRNPVYASAFNGKKTEMFATGDALGIQIWRLPDSLTGVRKGEEGAIRRMAAADDVSEFLRMQRSTHGR